MLYVDAAVLPHSPTLIQHTGIYLRQGGYVLPHICLSVSRITQKLVDKFL